MKSKVLGVHPDEIQHIRRKYTGGPVSTAQGYEDVCERLREADAIRQVAATSLNAIYVSLGNARQRCAGEHQIFTNAIDNAIASLRHEKEAEDDRRVKSEAQKAINRERAKERKEKNKRELREKEFKEYRDDILAEQIAKRAELKEREARLDASEKIAEASREKEAREKEAREKEAVQLKAKEDRRKDSELLKLDAEIAVELAQSLTRIEIPQGFGHPSSADRVKLYCDAVRRLVEEIYAWCAGNGYSGSLPVGPRNPAGSGCPHCKVRWSHHMKLDGMCRSIKMHEARRDSVARSNLVDTACTKCGKLMLVPSATTAGGSDICSDCD